MKTLLLTLAASLLLTGAALAQGSITRPLAHRRALPPAAPAPQSEGALQRGVRVGNPLQMLNPLAPPEYGDGSDLVVTRDDAQDAELRIRLHPPKPIALRLFSIAF